MARKYFGTDGIRGRANTPPMTADIAHRVALAAAVRLRNGSHRHKVVIAKDTRLSGYLIEPAMTAGFIAAGMDVFLVGPLPTPAAAMLTRSLRADLGVMISASHNPFHDNGIKLFAADGYKLSDETELDIEALMDSDMTAHLAPSEKLGRAARIDDAVGRYIEYAKSAFPKGLRLDGLKIVVDCAHGAAYKVAPRIFWELGADVVAIGVAPDGLNINKDCGATHTDALCEHVVKHGADIGIALDGDADRLIVCDETGAVVDGDQIMALIASDWHRTGRLTGGGVSATVMSNLGLERHLAGLGLQLSRTAVGDRYVMEDMRARGMNIGGEQSGHLILTDYATTGDGIIAALQVLAALKTANRKASDMCRVFMPVPQILKNVRLSMPVDLDAPAIRAGIETARVTLGDGGRILIRKSGTEPLVRVMAEGDDRGLVEQQVDDLCRLIAG